MIRRFIKAALVVLAALVGVGFVLYLLGLRIVLDGGGGPHLRFLESADKQAERIAQHREAQRSQTPPPSAPSPPAPGAGDSAGATPVLPTVPIPPKPDSPSAPAA